MQSFYFGLAAFHLVAVVATGILWMWVILQPHLPLTTHLRSIRAVHFGSLYLVSLFLGLAYAFQTLQIPPIHWLAFPAGLGSLVFFSTIGYFLPCPADLDPFYYWTRGWPLFWALVGTVCLILALLWTAGVLVWFSFK
jgi:hypothetical protein